MRSGAISSSSRRAPAGICCSMGAQQPAIRAPPLPVRRSSSGRPPERAARRQRKLPAWQRTAAAKRTRSENASVSSPKRASPASMPFSASSAAAASASGRAAALLDGDLAEHSAFTLSTRSAARFHSTSRDLAHAFRKQVEQPVRLDGAGDAHQRHLLVAAVFGLHRHQKSRSRHGARRRQLRRSAGGQLQLRALAAAAPRDREKPPARQSAARLHRARCLARRIDHAAAPAAPSARCAAPTAIPAAPAGPSAWRARRAPASRSPALSSAATVQPSSATPRRRASTISRASRGCSG